MKQPVNLQEKFDAGRKHDDELRETARRFIELAFEATNPPSEPDSETHAIAQEASDEYDRHADDISSGRMSHISEPTQEGAWNRLVRDVSRERSYDEDNAEPMDGNALLEKLVQAVLDRKKR